jgi:diguanylate cyclase (GGDEF)-like protein/PAS domain S-box-containing protein
MVLAAYQQMRIVLLHRATKNREELFQIVTENAADMIALVDMKGRRLYNSPAYKRILGYSTAELGETSAFEQIHPDDRFRVLEAAREARQTGVGKKLKYRIRHKYGSWKILESAASTIRNTAGEVEKLVIVNRDITDRKRAQERIEHNALHDGLTDLPNRRLFLDRLQQTFSRAQRNQHLHYSVLFIDLDGFKALKGSMGQACGDQLLKDVGLRLMPCIRSDDTIGRQASGAAFLLSRFGGDEFTVLLEGTGDPSDAMRVAKRIQAAVGETFLLDGRETRISASIGIALNASNHERAEDILQDAEVAVRRAKAMGGGRCEVFDEAMHARAVNRLQLEAELRTAISRNEFRVLYQPVFQLATKRIAGVEALLRWEHPKQGLISPYKFLEAAEDSGLLGQIGNRLIGEACERVSTWQRRYSTLTLAANISGRQFAHLGLIDDLRSALRRTGLASGTLHLEITEAVATVDAKLTSTILSDLKRTGVCVILDNCGSGNVSLRQLRQFPIEGLKIDRTWLERCWQIVQS